VILAPGCGEDVAYVGDRAGAGAASRSEPESDGKSEDKEEGSSEGLRVANTMTFSQKLISALRLMITPNRGIGWFWRVKGIQVEPYSSLPKSAYIKTHLLLFALRYLLSVFALGVMGFCTTLLKEWDTRPFWVPAALDVVLGWCGAIWAWNGINYVYSFFAAVSVAMGLCGQWEWPPLTGSLADAWSVRQMWMYVVSKNCPRPS
jgi:hypothetical protein